MKSSRGESPLSLILFFCVPRSSTAASSETNGLAMATINGAEAPALPIQPGQGAEDEMQRIKEATGAIPEAITLPSQA